MKQVSIFLAVFFLLTFYSCRSQHSKEQLKISDFRFESIFGTTVKYAKKSYCLLGSGFFRAPSSDNADSLIAAWIKNHSNAVVIPVSSFGPVNVDDKDSKMIYCWVTDNKDTLNNYLIKNGCYPGGTMIRPETWNEMEKREKELYKGTGEKPGVEVHIDKKSYDAFIKQIEAAELYARKNKLGIWLKEEEGK